MFVPNWNFTERRRAALEKFSETVWGNAQAVIKRSGDIEFIDLREHFPALRFIFAGLLKHDKVLVRDEYRIASLALETGTYRNGAYVTGQPGIGKTLFLLYLLVTLLGQKYAVALQHLGDGPYYVLFNNGAVSSHHLSDTAWLEECGFVWVLSDSNTQGISCSSTFFKSRDRIRVIQTTSLGAEHWREWSTQTGAQCYVMDIWSQKEIADLAALLRLNAERMITLVEIWGGVPRTILERIAEDDAWIEDDYRSRATRAIMQCAFTIPGVAADNASMFCLSRPRRNGETIDRTQASASVPTPTLRHILGEELSNHDVAIRTRFFTALGWSKESHSVAEEMFKSRLHDFLCTGNTIECTWVQGSLRGTITAIPGSEVSPRTKLPPFLRVAPCGFPGIDSAVVFEDAICAIQITIGTDHRDPLAGLRALREKLPDELKDVSWRVVFVGQTECTIKRVAEHWAGKLFFPTDATPLSIGWSVVNLFAEVERAIRTVGIAY